MEETERIRKAVIAALAALAMSAAFVGCAEADRVNYNITMEADNFNQIRQLTVINCFDSSILFQMTGKMSINADTKDEQLEVIVEDENGNYKKHFIGISDNVTYVVEDVTSEEIDRYTYHLNFNPNMLKYFDVTTVD